MGHMDAPLNVGRSQVLISSAMAVYSAAVQLGVALGTVTFVAVTGWQKLLGAAPALMLGGAGLAAGPAGRAMDRLGRMPVVATGFVAGAVGAAVVALGDPPRLAGPRRARTPPRRLRERDDPAAAHRRRRPRPGIAPRARDRARPLRLGRRRAARAVRLRARVRLAPPRDGRARAAVAPLRGDHAARDPALPRGASRPAPRRGDPRRRRVPTTCPSSRRRCARSCAARACSSRWAAR